MPLRIRLHNDPLATTMLVWIITITLALAFREGDSSSINNWFLSEAQIIRRGIRRSADYTESVLEALKYKGGKITEDEVEKLLKELRDKMASFKRRLSKVKAKAKRLYSRKTPPTKVQEKFKQVEKYLKTSKKKLETRLRSFFIKNHQ